MKIWTSRGYRELRLPITDKPSVKEKLPEDRDRKKAKKDSDPVMLAAPGPAPLKFTVLGKGR
jgi:hypothetical protein